MKDGHFRLKSCLVSTRVPVWHQHNTDTCYITSIFIFSNYYRYQCVSVGVVLVSMFVLQRLRFLFLNLPFILF